MKSTLSSLCKTCGNCCKAMVLPVRKPALLKKAQTEEWLSARGARIVSEDAETLYVKVDLPCPHLNKSDEGWTCDQYENRPEGCREFDGTKFDFLNCRWKSVDHILDLEKATEVHRRGGLRRTAHGVTMVRPHQMKVGERLLVTEAVQPYAEAAIPVPEPVEGIPKPPIENPAEVLEGLKTEPQATVQNLRKTGVKATYTMNAARQWNMEARNKYKDCRYLGDIGIREALQNSIDAVVTAIDRGQQKRGKISVSEQADGKGFDITDNGIGMSAEDIATKFLALGGTGKDVQGRFGGFGIAKAVILGPTETTKWELFTNEFYYNGEMAGKGLADPTNPEEVRFAESSIKGTRIQIRTEETIVTDLAKMYAETTVPPKGIKLTYIQPKEGAPEEVVLQDPFKGRKFEERQMTTQDGKTTVILKYYPRPPTDYDNKKVVRLIDDRAGALTQNIERAYGSFKGCLVIDIKTTETPGSKENKYPLTDSRMDFRHSEIERFVSNEVDFRSQEKLQAGRVGITQKSYTAKYSPHWAATIEKIAADPSYKAIQDEVAQAFKETNLEGILENEKVTPIGDVQIEQDVGYKGSMGGSVAAAKMMAAVEGLAKLYSAHLSKTMNAKQVRSIVGILPKPDESGSIPMAHFNSGSGEFGFNFKDFPKDVLESPICLAQYLVNEIQHELTHSFVHRHTEEFTGMLYHIQTKSASLFPQALKVASAALGQTATMKFESRFGPEEVVVNKRKWAINPVDAGWKKEMLDKFTELHKYWVDKAGERGEQVGGAVGLKPGEVIPAGLRDELAWAMVEKFEIPIDRIKTWMKHLEYLQQGWVRRQAIKEGRHNVAKKWKVGDTFVQPESKVRWKIVQTPEMRRRYAGPTKYFEAQRIDGTEETALFGPDEMEQEVKKSLEGGTDGEVESIAKSNDRNQHRQDNRNFRYVIKLN